MAESVSDLRVRYVETDQMGVVHHSAYLAWLEVARTDYLRGRGLSYRSLEESGFRMPVLSLGMNYHQPARYDDELAVRARLTDTTGVRFRFDYEVLRKTDGAVLCRGWTEHVVTDLAGKPRRLPKEMIALIGDGRE